MPFVQAKCTNCGADLEIDNTKDAAICPYCGSAFVVEKAINNYNVTNQIHAGTVNIYGGNSADFVIRGGVLERYNGAATEVVIPNSVKIIGAGAFEDCIGVTSVVIPDSVQEIGENTFHNCVSLVEITIGNGVRRIGRNAFDSCKSLVQVVIPDSVQEIGECIFNQCELLSTSVIGNSIRIISKRAFFNCKSLAEVTFGPATQEIDDYAFYGCGSLSSINIPNHVQRIGNGTFDGCNELASLTIPDSVRTIGFRAFADCSSLASVIIPDAIQRIDAYAFKGCCLLNSLIIPDSVQEIGCHAFDGCNLPEAERKEKYKFSDVVQKPQKNGCYVATAVYGSYDCPEVWTLRRFRDDTLDRTWYGRAFIRAYYAVSPTLVRWFGKTGWFRRLFKAPLDRLVLKLRRRGVQDTPYHDKY